MENKDHTHLATNKNNSLEQSLDRIQGSVKSYLRSEIKYLDAVLQYTIGRVIILVLCVVCILSVLITLGMGMTFYIFIPDTAMHQPTQQAIVYYSVALFSVLALALTATWICSKQVHRIANRYLDHWNN